MTAGRHGEHKPRKARTAADVDGLFHVGRHQRDELQGILDVTIPKGVLVVPRHQVYALVPPKQQRRVILEAIFRFT